MEADSDNRVIVLAFSGAFLLAVLAFLAWGDGVERVASWLDVAVSTVRWLGVGLLVLFFAIATYLGRGPAGQDARRVESELERHMTRGSGDDGDDGDGFDFDLD